MTITVKKTGEVATILLPQKFDFDSVEEFRSCYMNTVAREYVTDFRNTEYMDSSGLGMLLNMRRHLGDDAANISLINCRDQIKKILIISRFETKFQIS